MKNSKTNFFIQIKSQQEDSQQDDIENVVDNDDGEDLLLQKIAEEIEASTHYVESNVEDENDEAADGSSRKLSMKQISNF